MVHTRPETVHDAIHDGLASGVCASVFILYLAIGLAATCLIISAITRLPFPDLPKIKPNDKLFLFLICFWSIEYEVYQEGHIVDGIVEFCANWQLLSVVGCVRGIVISAILNLVYRVAAWIEHRRKGETASGSATTGAETLMVKEASAKTDA